MARHYGLRPLPVEGGLFRRTWAGPPDASGRPSGSAILVLLTAAPDDFSALHRLPLDEVWHFYRGDPLELLLLAPDGSDRLLTLGGTGGTGGTGSGSGTGAGEGAVQCVVPAGTWMGARVAPGGRWSLFGTTMAPGFLPADYEGADAGVLAARYPRRAALIRALCRPGAPLRMPPAGDGEQP
ncbi:cupin domain-containing protein [Streptomyces sp. JJ36]|uniref:cupin domain-containing protein n=1 Tax=Streptomyces sp. JJ36 TaxID=2736645 RepID=UPI001F3111A8|nr:cupin domain-containing protein [Streptomyces sp. JJ36]